MKKIINKIKNNKLIYVVVGLLIGLAITSGGVYAATVINASNVAFSGSTSGLTSPNMQAALNEAYNNCKTKCPDGYKCTSLPTYFEFGTPTTNSTTDSSTIGKYVFATLYSDKTSGGVCIDDGDGDGGLLCLKVNDYKNSVGSLQSYFVIVTGGYCTDNGSSFVCDNDDSKCLAASSGAVYCYDKLTGASCLVNDVDGFICSNY